MPVLRFYPRFAPLIAAVLIISAWTGCWKKIEYKGKPASASTAAPKTTASDASSSPPATSAQASVADVPPPADDAAEKVAPPSIPGLDAPSPPAWTTASVPSNSADADRYAAPAPPSADGGAPVTFAAPTDQPAATLPVAAAATPLKPDDDRYATASGDTSTQPAATPPAVSPSPVTTETAPSTSSPEAASSHADATPASDTVSTPATGGAPNSRQAAWTLGSNLSLAALAHDRGVAAKNVLVWFADAQTAAKILGTTLPELPEPAKADDESPASRRVVNYLLVNGQRIGHELAKQNGGQEGALLEIAIKSNILLLLYAPDTSAGKSIGAAIEQVAPQAKLPAELWRPLVDALNKQAPPKDVQAVVRKMHADIEQYLASGAGQSTR